MTTVDEILRALNKHKTRATYSAVGGLLGIPAIAVGSRLGTHRPEASWIVGARTNLPTGYSQTNCHVDLTKNKRIIRTALELQQLIDSVPPNCGLDDQSRRVTRIIGLDLAWNCEKNGSGVAIGRLDDGVLVLEDVHTAVRGIGEIEKLIAATPDIRGIAIDAPLIIKNDSGYRPCETALNQVYQPYWAGAYAANLQMTWKSGLILSDRLESAGFEHLDRNAEKWQIECYPHPALVELFSLSKRHKYKQKNGMTREDVQQGQIQLARYLDSLKTRVPLPLRVADNARHCFDEQRIATLSGQALKDNEDGLDAAICLYVAAMYAIEKPTHCFGDIDNGYIVVPMNAS